MHAVSPAPVSLYFYCVDAIEGIFRALSQAIPSQVAAGVGAHVQVLFAYGMNNDGTFWGAAYNMTAGQGAPTSIDGGGPLMAMGAGSMRAMSCEIFESRTPFVIDKFELARDSAGNGQFRGSPGIDFEFRASKPLAATILLDGTKTPPGRGLHGGRAGRPNAGAVRQPDGATTSVTKVANLPMQAGAVIEVRTGGGGGYGPLEKRDPELVRKDIVDGHMSEEAARQAYPHAF
jgi:N-methylhydantoinase B